jgi:sigma-B regulation protein RsbU (phosphoserine phosphatase)
MSSDVVDTIGLGPRLLVVDDNEDNRYTLILHLEIEGYENITVAEDGEAALEFLRTREFDLVLLDVMMPKVDGFQVLARLKAEGRLHNIPVIMISALNEIDSVVRCIELGAVDYLSKPFNPVLLKARVGASLEKKRLRDEVRAHLIRIEEELESARQLQLSMVPTVFPQPTVQRPIEISAMMEPAREVGGDLYDFFETDDGKFCFFIGDVSGKGVASALFMARAKNLIRLVTRLIRGANGSAPTPADIVTMVNRELCQDNASMMFVTLFFGMFDPRTGRFQFTNAGHNPPYHVNGNDVTPITGIKGHPLGTRHNSTYENGHLTLAPGDALFLYTDGVTEAANKKDDLFTEERLQAVLRETAGYRPEDLIKAVANAVRGFADGAPQSDDITALALRRVAFPSKE